MFLKDFNEYQQKLFLGLARELIEADNVISEQEKTLIAALSSEMGQQELIRNPSDDVLKEFFPDRISRVSVMLELVGLATCDGQFAAEEDAIIKRVQRIFEISDDQVNAYQNWVKKLFQTYGEAAAFFK